MPMTKACPRCGKINLSYLKDGRHYAMCDECGWMGSRTSLIKVRWYDRFTRDGAQKI